MTSKLELYNDTLLYLGEAKLSALSEDNTARRALDDAYDVTAKYCLERGFWNHAIRVVQIDSSASVDPTFGYTYAFTKPDDWLRTFVISSSEYLTPPLLEYVDEPNYWFADCDPLYVRYISNSTSCGMDLSIWPQSFADYVAVRLACRTCKRITGSDTGTERLFALEKKARAVAMSTDAMNEPPAFPPGGTWAGSRRNGMFDQRRSET